MIGPVIFLSFAVLLLVGTPIAVCLGVSSVFGMLIDGAGRPLDTIMTMLPRIFSSATSKFVLLAVPFFILGGIYCGIFTPTFAAAASAVYGLFVGFFIYKTLKLKDLYEIFVNSTTTTAVVMFITATASLFAYILTRARLDLAISDALTEVTYR